MSKVLPATCTAQGAVKIENIVVPEAIVYSEGKQASSGVALIQADEIHYLTSSATDIKTTIEKLVDSITSLNAALSQIATSLTSIGAGMTGASTAPPPTLATDVTTINTKVTELNSIKTALNTLKGALK